MNKCAFALLVVLSAAVSCSTASDPGSVAPEPAVSTGSEGWSDLTSANFSAEVTQLARRLIETHGEDAPLVLLRALDSGYDPDQLAAGIRSDSIDEAGTIAGVEPSRPNGEVLESASGMNNQPVAAQQILLVARFQPDTDKVMVDELRSFFDEDGDSPDVVLVAAIIALHGNGYSLEQIVNAIVLGEAAPWLTGCLLGPGAQNVRPAFPIPGNVCNEIDVTGGPPAAAATQPEQIDPAETPADEPWTGPLRLSETLPGRADVEFRGMLETMTFEISVVDAIVQLSIEETWWSVLEGSYEDPGCAVRVVDVRSGSGPFDASRFVESSDGQAARHITFDLTVESSLVVHSEGDTCWAIDLSAPHIEFVPGSSRGSFRGVVGEWGVEGSTVGGMPFRADA